MIEIVVLFSALQNAFIHLLLLSHCLSVKFGLPHYLQFIFVIPEHIIKYQIKVINLMNTLFMKTNFQR